MRDGSLRLRPHYQRGSVWNEANKSFLIDSVLRGYPIPLIVLQDEIDPDGSPVRRVVDGQQRLRTLISFAAPDCLTDTESGDDFRYTPPEYRTRKVKLTFAELPDELKKRILKVRLSTVSIDVDGNDNSVLEVYDRLNSTGVALNAQELRFAKRTGAFSDACYRLARANQSRWLSWGIFNNSDIVRMKEVEFTAELVLLIVNGVDKTGVAAVNAAYDSWSDEFPEQEKVENIFLSVMHVLESAYSFPTNPDPIAPFRKKGWFYTAFAHVLEESNALSTDHTSRILEPDVQIECENIEATLQIATSRIRDKDRLSHDVVRAISGSSSDKASRVIRLKFLTDSKPQIDDRI
ncbi:DUF262 domain-containing protein [Rhodococcus coprophilus]|uniref:DUF262 domain-containing protein n=1 Tax=Rhodococcus coprophilus TaxID=38310 RepID=UPI0033E7DDC4